MLTNVMNYNNYYPLLSCIVTGNCEFCEKNHSNMQKIILKFNVQWEWRGSRIFIEDSQRKIDLRDPKEELNTAASKCVGSVDLIMFVPTTILNKTRKKFFDNKRITPSPSTTNFESLKLSCVLICPFFFDYLFKKSKQTTTYPGVDVQDSSCRSYQK